MATSSGVMRTIRPLAGLGLMLWLAGCNQAPEAAKDAPAVVAVTTPALSASQKAEILKSLPAPYNAADLINGQKQFNKCRSCHTLHEGEMTLVGPNLYTVFGRKSGSLAGYTFSEPMKAHNVVWDYATLDTYLTTPLEVVKGTKMGFMGLKTDVERRDLIAYLRVETTKAK